MLMETTKGRGLHSLTKPILNLTRPIPNLTKLIPSLTRPILNLTKADQRSKYPHKTKNVSNP